MVSKVELGNLLDFAIGTPETGAVNLKILHSFLHKLISHLAVSNVEVEVGSYSYVKYTFLQRYVYSFIYG